MTFVADRRFRRVGCGCFPCEYQAFVAWGLRELAEVSFIDPVKPVCEGLL